MPDMALREMNLPLLLTARWALLGAYWRYRQYSSGPSGVWHESEQRSWDGNEADLRARRSRTPGYQGLSRTLVPVAAPVIEVNPLGRSRLIQLTGSHEEVDVEHVGRGSRLSRTSEHQLTRMLASFQTTRFSVDNLLHRWIASATRLRELRVAFVPTSFRLPRHLAVWLLRSRTRIERSGWDAAKLQEWAEP